MAQTIAVLAQKGGVGKSTIALNLACALMQMKKAKVLVVDTDSRVRSASQWREQTPDDALAPSVISISHGKVSETLPDLTSGYDYVVIDGQAHEHERIGSSIKAADLVLIPVKPSPFDFWASDDLVTMIQDRQSIMEGRPLAAFVVSMQKQGTRLASAMDELLMQYPEIPVFSSRTTNRVTFAESLVSGESVLSYRPGSKAADEVKNLTNETLRHLNGNEPLLNNDGREN